MSKKTALAVLTALFPKNFDRESIGTITRMVKALERIKHGGWYSTLGTFGKLSTNHTSHVSKAAVKAGYMKVEWDVDDRRCRVYHITQKGKRFLTRLEKLSNGV